MHIFLLCSLISVHGEEKRVILDEKFDELLPSIHQFILENGLDPMRLKDYSESIFPHLVSNYFYNMM